jgi:DNA mismatch repair protein MutS
MRKEYVALYKEHSQKYGPNTCIFLEVGKFYEMYDSIQAETGQGETSMQRAVALLNIQLSYKENNERSSQTERSAQSGTSSQTELFAGIPEQSLHKFASILTREGWTVVVVDQEKVGSKVVARNVSQILSPGTHVESFSSDSVFIGCLYLQQSTHVSAPQFSISVADVSTGRCLSYESKLEGKYDSWNFDSLLHFFQVHPIRELIVLWKGDAYKCPAEQYLRQNLGIPSTLIHIKQFTSLKGDSADIMNKMFRCKSLNSIHTLLSVVPNSLMELSFTHLLQFLTDHGNQTLEEHVIWNPDTSVYLGNNVLNQLNMISSKDESILSYFQKTFTPLGKRGILERLLYPISDVNTLSMRVLKLETAISLDNSLKKQVEFLLKQISDLQRIHHKFYSYSINAQDILALDQSYTRILSIMEHLEETTLNSTTDFINSIRSYLKVFHENFDVEKAKQISQDISFLKDSVSPKSFLIEKKISEQKKRANIFLEELNSFAKENLVFEEKDSNIYSIEASRRIITNIDIKLKNSKKELWPNPSIEITLRKSSGSLTCKLLEDLHNYTYSYRDTLKSAIKQELPPICNMFTDNFKDLWIQLENYVTQTDILFTLAKVSKEKNFTKPIFQDNTERSGFQVVGLRHPLIEAQNTRVEYVKHSIVLDSEQTGILLYGMNASGKSSLMKAVGVSILLAQVGCYVPAESLTLKPYKSIYTRILNQDNIYAGLSSFAVEMLELREILKRADQYSLVLGDELCSGTESISATSLVASGIIWLHKKNTSFIFATHYHELNNIAQIKTLERLKIFHLKVHYDQAKDLLIYDRNLEPGPGNTYYGLEVAKAMNIPSEYLELANQIRKELLQEKIRESSYNSNLTVQSCEICKNSIHHMLEVHHVVQQNQANETGFLPNGGHKNSLRNLIVLCTKCHDDYHAGKIEIGNIKQTSAGEVREIKMLEQNKKQSKWKNEELNIIHSYLKKYSNLGLKRLCYDLETNEDIKISESSLRAIRKEL